MDALPNISDSRKQNIKEAIKNATKIVDVDKLVSDAQTEDAENLKRAQTNGKQTVGDLDKLDDSRKKGFQDRIDAAATIDEVDAIVKEAIAANVLQRQKDAAKEIVEKLPNLREETRDSALQGIDDALTKEQIDKLVEDAKLEDQTELKKHQEIAKDRVENFPNLDDARKQEIKDAIDASDNIAEIDQIVADAKAEDSGNLEDAINAGKGTVDKLPSLKDDVKQQLKDKLDAAETVQEVKDILDDAKAQDILQGQKDAAKPQIDDLKNLDDKTKQDISDAIDAATDKEAIDQIIADAKKNDQAVLDARKETSKDIIDGLKNLDDVTKQEILDKIKDADNLVDVDKLVDDAKISDANKLKELQDKAKEAVDKLPNLTPEEKAGFDKQIDDAVSGDELDRIVDAANKQADKNLEDAKDEAKQEIDKNPNLSDKEKDEIKKEIDDAKTTDEVDKKVEEIKPIDPTDPKEPVDPTDPTDPKEPVDPTDPTDPKEPVEPTDPKEPVDPTDPTDPKEPVEPTDPTDPKKPVNPDGSNDDLNPKKPVAPMNPADSKETANPTTPKDDLAETKRKVKDQLEQLVGLDNQTKDALMKQIDAANSNEEIYAILNQARKALPNTGVASSHLLEAFGMLMLSLGLFMPFRRKKNGK
mgnify:CR=1 FL=1